MNNINWPAVFGLTAFFGVALAFLRLITYNPNKDIKKVFDTLPDFTIDAFHLGGNKSASLAVDNGRKKICFIRMRKPVIYDLNQVLKCEFIYDWYWEVEAIKQTFTGAARIDGKRIEVSGSTYVDGDKTRVFKSLGLKIIMNDTEKSVYRLLIITEPEQENSYTYQKAYEVFEEWLKLFEHYAIEKTKS